MFLGAVFKEMGKMIPCWYVNMRESVSFDTWALSQENLSSRVSDQVLLKPISSATEIS